jgi:hypothetical protein
MSARLGGEVTTLGGAWGEFRAKRSPRILAAGVAATLMVRLVLGGWTWRDGVAAATMLVIYPFGEWAIHVYLLHLPPIRFRGRRVELATAKAHREHHERPNHLGLILLGPGEAAALMFAAVPFAIALFALPVWLIFGAPPLPSLTSGALTGYVLVAAYEWTHFLIHTAYRPRSRYFRRIHRTHRLHHFKNEHYWHGITNVVADRAFGTLPDHEDVPRSRTARTLAVD